VSVFKEEPTEKWSRRWRLLHPIVSWALGAGLFIFATVTHGQQSPEWYALIGGLIGGPFITLLKDAKKPPAPPREE
jgi:hypothetical protein